MTLNDNKSINQIRVVVAGRNYCNILTTARAIGEAGYEVEVLKVFKTKPSALKFLQAMKPDAYSKYVVSYNELVTNNDRGAVAEYLIKNADSSKKLLIPVDDYVCCAVDEHLDELTKHYIVPNAKGVQGEIVRLMDKNVQKQIALEHKLPLLSGVLISCKDGKYSIPDTVVYPCFIKPNVSMLSTKGVMRACKDENELDAVLSRFAQKGDFEILVEELADIKNEYSILGMCVDNKAYSPGVFRVIEGGHHDRKGVAINGEVVDISKFDAVIAGCNRFVEALGYTGLFDIDLIETTDGSIYFVELNFRAGASTYALSQCGCNLYKLLADALVKNELDYDKPVVEHGKRFVSEKVLMEEYARGDVDKRYIAKAMSDADIFFVRNENDIKPFKVFNKYYKFATILRFIYKIKG